MDTKAKLTKSQEVANDVAALLRARNSLIWIVTREEARVERYLFEAAAAARYETKTWDIAQGIVSFDGKTTIGDSEDPKDALGVIETCSKGASGKREDRAVYIMRDLPVWLEGPPGAPVLRKLRNLARSLPGIETKYSQSIIVLTPESNIPKELSNHATVIEWPLPDRDEIAATLDAALKSVVDNPSTKLTMQDVAPNGTREAAIDAAIGLSGEEASACYACSLVRYKKIDPAVVAKEKRRVIAREKVLEWFDPLPGGLDAVGGLENLKKWLLARGAAFGPKARAYGLPSPKGAMLVGISGCGKSLTAKAIATAWGVPLLRLDLGALKSKFVGESEGNLRKALKVIEAIGRCVVWLDEIEKALQGATSGSADGGVSSDALGTVLTWMQERRGEAFVIATANNVDDLPPEFLRKGRWDEIWWIDMPNEEERRAVLTATLRQYGRGRPVANATDALIDIGMVADATDGFTGAEIAAIVPDAMFTAFNDGEREMGTKDLIDAAKTVTKLGDTAKEKIAKQREWAKNRARMATAPITATVEQSTGRVLEL